MDERQLSNDLTQALDRAGQGDPQAAEALFPLVYDHLRRLAASRLAKEAPGNTLQPTALVHEAFLRIAGERGGTWNGRKHFLCAATLAMRRILVDRARARKGPTRGGGRARVALPATELETPVVDSDDQVDWIMLDEALAKLQTHDEDLARVVHLRYFAGLSVDEVAHLLDVSPSTVDRDWKVARAWLLREMNRGGAA